MQYLDCALDENYCTAALIVDSDKGCLTYSPVAETPGEDGWEETKRLGWEDLDEDEKDDLDRC